MTKSLTLLAEALEDYTQDCGKDEFDATATDDNCELLYGLAGVLSCVVLVQRLCKGAAAVKALEPASALVPAAVDALVAHGVARAKSVATTACTPPTLLYRWNNCE